MDIPQELKPYNLIEIDSKKGGGGTDTHKSYPKHSPRCAGLCTDAPNIRQNYSSSEGAHPQTPRPPRTLAGGVDLGAGEAARGGQGDPREGGQDVQDAQGLGQALEHRGIRGRDGERLPHQLRGLLVVLRARVPVVLVQLLQIGRREDALLLLDAQHLVLRLRRPCKRPMMANTCRTIARHASQKVTPGDAGELRSCPKVLQQLPIKCSSGPGHVLAKIWPKSANGGRTWPNLCHCLANLLTHWRAFGRNRLCWVNLARFRRSVANFGHNPKAQNGQISISV